MYIEADDAKLLLAEVGRFARERIGSAVARPETPVDVFVLDALTREARELGILPQEGAGGGFGLWEGTDDAGGMALSLGILAHVGYANAGIAVAWHRSALARWLSAALGAPFDAEDLHATTLVPTGHFGLARTAAARWIKSADQSDEEVALLADWLDRTAHTTTVIAPSPWSTLFWPVWRDGLIAWQRADRSQLTVTRLDAQHGLDELAAFAVRAGAGASGTATPDAGASRAIFGQVLALDMIGLLAIATGAVTRGHEMARDFAALRTQGGVVIARHPAVQQMLSEIEIARRQAEAALDGFAKPIGDIDIGTVAAARAGTHPLLCHAANQVVQIHGGIGYMRDAGAEKIVRDVNMLKLMTGGTREAHAFVAGWTGTFA